LDKLRSELSASLGAGFELETESVRIDLAAAGTVVATHPARALHHESPTMTSAQGHIPAVR